MYLVVMAVLGVLLESKACPSLGLGWAVQFCFLMAVGFHALSLEAVNMFTLRPKGLAQPGRGQRKGLTPVWILL